MFASTDKEHRIHEEARILEIRRHLLFDKLEVVYLLIL